MKIHFHITRKIKSVEIRAEQRYLTWVGEIDWPSLPPEGSISWCHCGGWAVETICHVYFNGPDGLVSEDPAKAPITIEVKTSEEVMEHLVNEHGFEDKRY